MDRKDTKADSPIENFAPAIGRQIYSGTFFIPDIGRIKLLNEILATLDNQGLDKELHFWVRLAVDEAVINAIVHGHGENIDEPRLPVRVDCIIDDESLAVRITDTGLGFDPSKVPDPTLDENLWNVAGRGIFLMRKAMDEVIFSSIGNSVLLIRKYKEMKRIQ